MKESIDVEKWGFSSLALLMHLGKVSTECIEVLAPLVKRRPRIHQHLCQLIAHPPQIGDVAVELLVVPRKHVLGQLVPGQLT